MEDSNKKRILIIIIVTILTLALAGMIIFYFMQKNKMAKQIKELENKVKQLENEKADIEKRAEEFAARLEEAVKNTKVEIKDENQIEIKELGIKIKVNNDIKDIVYFIDSSNIARFSTKSLMAADYKASQSGNQQPGGIIFGCSPEGSPIGVIAKYNSKSDIPTQPAVPQNKAVGNFYVTFASPNGLCSSNQAVIDLQTKQINLFKQVFDTIEPIQ